MRLNNLYQPFFKIKTSSIIPMNQLWMFFSTLDKTLNSSPPVDQSAYKAHKPNKHVNQTSNQSHQADLHSQF